MNLRNDKRIAEIKAICEAVKNELTELSPRQCKLCGAGADCFTTSRYTSFYCGQRSWQGVSSCTDCHPEIPALVVELDRRIIENDQRQTRYYRQRDYHQALRRSLSGISPRFRRCTFKAYFPRNQSQADALQQILRWSGGKHVRDSHPFCLLFGPFGIGKTHLLRATQRRIGYRDGLATYVNDAEFSAAWQQSHDRNSTGPGPNEIINSAKTATCLLYDDLGKCKLTDAWARAVYEIFNYRYEHCLPTLISTNSDPSSLPSFVGAATADRILDGSNIILGAQGASMRGAA